MQNRLREEGQMVDLSRSQTLHKQNLRLFEAVRQANRRLQPAHRRGSKLRLLKWEALPGNAWCAQAVTVFHFSTSEASASAIIRSTSSGSISPSSCSFFAAALTLAT